MNKLKLYQQYMGVFVKVTPQTTSMLREIMPYITYGYELAYFLHTIIPFGRVPSRDMISTLIYKRGHMRKDAKVTPISSNQVVEDTLGSQGLICIEDLVHSLSVSDKYVDKVLAALWYHFFVILKPSTKNVVRLNYRSRKKECWRKIDSQATKVGTGEIEEQELTIS